MRSGLCLLAALALSAAAQEADWRRSIRNLPEHPPATTTVQDVARFEKTVLAAAPYMATLTPGDYEANRDLVRRMTTYLAEIETMNQDPRMRLAIGRARRAVMALRVGYPMLAQPVASGPLPEIPPPPPTSRPEGPPFALAAPAIDNVSDSDREVASDLSTRYDNAAARATAAWQNAEVLRQNLASQGMLLNTQTATSVARLQLYFDLAAGALRDRDWQEAKTNLERAEYETERVLKVVGR